MPYSAEDSCECPGLLLLVDVSPSANPQGASRGWERPHEPYTYTPQSILPFPRPTPVLLSRPVASPLGGSRNTPGARRSPLCRESDEWSSFLPRVPRGVSPCPVCHCLPSSPPARANSEGAQSPSVRLTYAHTYTHIARCLAAVGEPGLCVASLAQSSPHAFTDAARADGVAAHVCVWLALTRGVAGWRSRQCTVFDTAKCAWFDPPLLAGKMDEAGFVRSLIDIHSLIKAELQAGTPLHRIVLGGFSQGGCIANHIGLMAKDVSAPHPPNCPPLLTTTPLSHGASTRLTRTCEHHLDSALQPPDALV